MVFNRKSGAYMRAVVWISLVLTLVGAVGCARVHEPWVSSKGQWSQERARSPDQQVELRSRLANTQVDR